MSKHCKHEHLYSTDHLQTGMKARSVSSGIFTLGSQVGLLLLGIVRGAVLARLLSPEDYGLQGMLLAVISFALMFKDLGLATATVQEKVVTHQQVSNLFWINTVMGLLSGLIVMALGPALSSFYREPRLLGMALLLSPSYLLGGMVAQPQALLQRQMRFGSLALVNLGAACASAAVAMLLAWRGYGYWSLVWLTLANNVFLLIFLLLVTRWHPTAFRRGAGSFKMVRSGGYITVLNIFGTLCKHLDGLLLGRLVGTVALGIYSRALMVLGLVETQLRMSVSCVALPALSSVQGDFEKFWGYYKKYLSALAFLSMPVAVFLLIFADNIVVWYLGPKWSDVTAYLRVFAVGAFVTPAMLCLDRIPLALGNNRQYMWTGVAGGTIKSLAIAIGAYGWGAMGCAIAIVVSNYVIWVPYYLIATNGTACRWREYVTTLVAPVSISVLSGLPVWAMRSRFGYGESWQISILEMAGFCLLALTLLLLADLFRVGTDLNLVASLRRRWLEAKAAV
jgi:PST family polysaccharide transporter